MKAAYQVYSLLFFDHLGEQVRVDNGHFQNPKKDFLPPFFGFPRELVGSTVMVSTIYRAHFGCVVEDSHRLPNLLNPPSSFVARRDLRSGAVVCA